MQDRRKEQRGRTYLGSEVAFNNRCSTIDCSVRNMSQSGAKLEFAHTALIPSEFDLMIRQKGSIRRARLVWRRELAAGVAFIASETGAFGSNETARQIRKLETERETLARRVADLSEPAI